MSDYHRSWQTGGCWFFTHVLHDRRGSDLLVCHVEELRDVVRSVRRRHPFYIHGWVVLPDHFHCLISLPEGDTDYALRWRLIKSRFSKSIPKTEAIDEVRLRRGERGIWQRRYWEHMIRDQQDFNNHMDYIHINPVKHGLVNRVQEWPCSTFHRCVERGLYPIDWADSFNADQLPYQD
jgi:putative transposase